jgi:hypothetical protein
VVNPAEGARLAYAVMAGGSDIRRSKTPVPVDQLLRRWPVDGVTAEWAESEDEFIGRIRAKDVPANAGNVLIVDASEIPADRTFRDAWAIDGGKLGHDMVKARELHKNALRELRAPLLRALDVDYMKAHEAGDTVRLAEIAQKKKVLRDVTADPAIDAAKTPEELKAVIPAALVSA